MGVLEFKTSAESREGIWGFGVSLLGHITKSGSLSQALKKQVQIQVMGYAEYIWNREHVEDLRARY